jgi:hypothetical protein
MAVGAHYRDKDGEIGRKYGDTLIGTLRISYGSRFAKGCSDDEKLSEALAKLEIGRTAFFGDMLLSVGKNSFAKPSAKTKRIIPQDANAKHSARTLKRGTNQ